MTVVGPAGSTRLAAALSEERSAPVLVPRYWRRHRLIRKIQSLPLLTGLGLGESHP